VASLKQGVEVKNSILFLFIVVSFLLGSCETNPDLEFIQGTWVYHSEHLQNIVGEQHLTAVWRFHKGTFEYSACCFNIDTYQTGSYSVRESENGFLLLELFDIKGNDFATSGEMFIRIDRENETLSINGASPFTRQEDWSELVP
jgi:hypothetical protein